MSDIFKICSLFSSDSVGFFFFSWFSLWCHISLCDFWVVTVSLWFLEFREDSLNPKFLQKIYICLFPKSWGALPTWTVTNLKDNLDWRFLGALGNVNLNHSKSIKDSLCLGISGKIFFPSKCRPRQVILCLFPSVVVSLPSSLWWACSRQVLQIYTVASHYPRNLRYPWPFL